MGEKGYPTLTRRAFSGLPAASRLVREQEAGLMALELRIEALLMGVRQVMTSSELRAEVERLRARVRELDVDGRAKGLFVNKKARNIAYASGLGAFLVGWLFGVVVW